LIDGHTLLAAGGVEFVSETCLISSGQETGASRATIMGNDRTCPIVTQSNSR
jgi:hypothetical protein